MEETDHFLFLIRPRRFGKSLFLSMLRAYYDFNEKDKFQEEFAGMWIAEHPTEWRGNFQMMYFDYSRLGVTRAYWRRISNAIDAVLWMILSYAQRIL